MSRVVVIGAGLAGLTAALRLARAGARVTLATKGPGGLQLSQGTIDILGYSPERVRAPSTPSRNSQTITPTTRSGPTAWLRP